MPLIKFPHVNPMSWVTDMRIKTEGDHRAAAQRTRAFTTSCSRLFDFMITWLNQGLSKDTLEGSERLASNDPIALIA